ncbi:hypothetical protein D3C81_1650570 [compost metagenome]
MPAQGFTQDVRGVAATLAGAIEIVVQCSAVVRVHTVVDDRSCALARRQATQVGQALLGDQDVDVVLGVVDMADHRHHAGNRAAFGYRLGDEHRQVGVTGEVTRAADAVHHPGAADVGGVDVAVDVELQRGVDTDYP